MQQAHIKGLRDGAESANCCKILEDEEEITEHKEEENAGRNYYEHEEEKS